MMTHPLISLWRHDCRIDIIEGRTSARVDWSDPQSARTGNVPRYFSSAGDALLYLRFWRGNPSAMAELRGVLQRTGASGALQGGQADDVLKVLAGRLAQGVLCIFEVAVRRPLPGRLVAPSKSSPAATLASLTELSDVPAPAILPTLLPLLEETQIEGAEVLPEIEQSLAQLDLSLINMSGATESLQPTPDKVPEVKTAMERASAEITSTLDAL